MTSPPAARSPGLSHPIDYSERYLALAARFRRITVNHAANLRKAIIHAAEAAAKLTLRARDDGLVPLSVQFFALAPTDAYTPDSSEWSLLWAAICQSLYVDHPSELPADASCGRRVEGQTGIHLEVGADDLLVRAENYATVCEWLAGMTVKMAQRAIDKEAYLAQIAAPQGAKPSKAPGRQDGESDGMVLSSKLPWPDEYKGDRKRRDFLNAHKDNIPSKYRGQWRYVDAAAFIRLFDEQNKAAFEQLDKEGDDLPAVVSSEVFIDGARKRLTSLRAKKKRRQ